MKIDVAKMKKGTIVDLDGSLMKVLDMSFMQMQQRQGSYTFKVQNIVTGNVQQVAFKSGTALDLADVSRMSAVFLYVAGDTYSFMENDTGVMHDLDKSVVEDVAGYLKENLDVFLEKHGENVLSVMLPATIQYAIKETVPGIR
jgi:elongation factor P